MSALTRDATAEDLGTIDRLFRAVHGKELPDWAKAFAGWQNDGAKQTFARLAQNSVAVGSPAERRGLEPLGVYRGIAIAEDVGITGIGPDEHVGQRLSARADPAV